MATETDDRGQRTVPDVLIACAQHRPAALALVEPDGLTVTSAELLDLTQAGASLLGDRGVRRGDRVAVDASSMSWNEVAVSYFAAAWAGAAAVLTAGEGTARAAAGMGVAAVITSGGFAADTEQTITPAELVAAPGRAGPSPAEPHDVLDLVFTSGTTGEPKPVPSTHSEWTRSVRPELLAGRGRRVVVHTGVPIAVSGGLHGILLNHVARGVTSVHTGSVTGLIAAGDRYGASELHMSPHTARSLVKVLSPGADWAARIRIIRLVGSPVPAAVADGLRAVFPQARVVSLYGLTEGGAALVVKRLNERRPQDSIGRPAPGTEVRVLGPDGAEVAAGQVGELAVRVMSDGPEPGAGPVPDHRERAAQEWTRSGDMGFIGPDGHVRLVGRSKDLIFLRAGRVSPEAIEERIARVIPGNVDFAVAGVSGDGDWDRIAVFLAGDNAERLADTERRLSRMLGPFRPDLVTVTERIPRGPFGKPLRRLLVQDLDAARPDA
jgi:acyl-CoA synthetase (AMP-forming)/AMP-acid ligase II